MPEFRFADLAFRDISLENCAVGSSLVALQTR